MTEAWTRLVGQDGRPFGATEESDGLSPCTRGLHPWLLTAAPTGLWYQGFAPLAIDRRPDGATRNKTRSGLLATVEVGWALPTDLKPFVQVNSVVGGAHLRNVIACASAEASSQWTQWAGHRT
jgi:hypothetical protein